jgi:hypothetical protein
MMALLHARPHRGRKRCGMRFGLSSVRRNLGLLSQPRYDPDVAAGRLAIGDPYLARVLYPEAVQRQRPASTPAAARRR